MNPYHLTLTQVAAERRAIELLLQIARASRATRARDLDFVEALIRQERRLQAELDLLPPSISAAKAEQPSGKLAAA